MFSLQFLYQPQDGDIDQATHFGRTNVKECHVPKLQEFIIVPLSFVFSHVNVIDLIIMVTCTLCVCVCVRVFIRWELQPGSLLGQILPQEVQFEGGGEGSQLTES